MARYNVLIKCAQIRKLIEENKYVKALEIIEKLDLRRNYPVSDLYRFAEVYIKADRFDEAKQIYYSAYEKTHSKRVMKQLIMLTLRMNEIKEAKELFLEYEMIAKPTLDLYELRYQLAKAEGVSRKVLINILEDLRKEEFTEEWGFQLAKLYELEGNREKCREVCDDIILWFGKGSIVNKAKELRKACESEVFPAAENTDIPDALKPDINEEKSVVPTLEPVIQKEERQEEPQEKYKVSEDNVYLSDKGFSYFTLRDAIMQLQGNSIHQNFVIAGGEERISMAVTKKILKQLASQGDYKAKNVAKITAEKLNHIHLEDRLEKLLGGCMLILNAQDITTETKEQLLQVMEKHGEDLVVILTGEFDEVDCWLDYHRDLESRFYCKIKL